MIERAEINRIGRWTVTVDGTTQSKHNEQKEAYENGIWLKYSYPESHVLVLPPIMEINLTDTKKPELVAGGENVEMT